MIPSHAWNSTTPLPSCGKQTAWIQTQPAFYASLPQQSRAVPTGVARAQGGEKAP